MSGILSYSEFLNEAEEFIEISNKFGDAWTLKKNPSNQEYGTYLCFNQKLNIPPTIEASSSKNSDEIKNQSNSEIINIEYHVVYSISYQVPILLFRAHRSNGSMISLEDSWRIFGDNFLSENSSSKSNLYSILTQMDHPIIFKPFLSLHPCRTSEILSNTPNSRNLIVTFLSLMGPYVKLNLSENYGIHFK